MLYSSVYGIIKAWNCSSHVNKSTTTANSPDTNTFRRRVMTACSYRSPSTPSSFPRSRIPQLMTRSASATPCRKGSAGRISNRMIQSVLAKSNSSDVLDGSCEQLAEEIASPLRMSEMLLSRCRREPSPTVPKYTSPSLTLPLSRVLFVRNEHFSDSDSSFDDISSTESEDECDLDLKRKLRWTRNQFGGRAKPTAEEVMHLRHNHLSFCQVCRYDQLLRISKTNKSTIRSRCICDRSTAKSLSDNSNVDLLNYAILCAFIALLLEFLDFFLSL
uniref:DUF3399 domain-containing protein n=1 Tax=Steinernema glaseri TaxID=37863 RepID=A0A1I8AW01_9BILA